MRAAGKTFGFMRFVITVNAARGGCARREVFENLDRLCDRRDRDPFRRFTCALLALVRGRAYAMAHDQAIIAAGERQTTRTHGLYLTIAHAGEVGADDIGCSLQHALFVEKGLDVEAVAPRATRLRADRDRRIHATHLDIEFVDGGGDQIWRAGGELEMCLGFGRCVDTNMKMEKMHVYRRGDRTGACILTN